MKLWLELSVPDPRTSSLLLKASKEVPLPPHVKQESQQGHVLCGEVMSQRLTYTMLWTSKLLVLIVASKIFNLASETNTKIKLKLTQETDWFFPKCLCFVLLCKLLLV